MTNDDGWFKRCRDIGERKERGEKVKRVADLGGENDYDFWVYRLKNGKEKSFFWVVGSYSINEIIKRIRSGSTNELWKWVNLKLTQGLKLSPKLYLI